jgi:hypothetical protein
MFAKRLRAGGPPPMTASGSKQPFHVEDCADAIAALAGLGWEHRGEFVRSTISRAFRDDCLVADADFLRPIDIQWKNLFSNDWKKLFQSLEKFLLP